MLRTYMPHTHRLTANRQTHIQSVSVAKVMNLRGDRRKGKSGNYANVVITH